jgi:hypothetical protein
LIFSENAMPSAKSTTIEDIRAALAAGDVIPYLGPGVLAAQGAVPGSPEALAAIITARVSVPHKIRGRLTAAAQFIENFKHRKTLVDLMSAAFIHRAAPEVIQRWVAALPRVPLIVDAWYDTGMQDALAARADWGQAQGLSQAEHFGTWHGWYTALGVPTDAEQAKAWKTLLYKPIGGVAPAANYLVSDSDYVEVLTEIDIQTPIPLEVQSRRRGRSFLFLGCRFNDQLQRTFARQIMKRSSDRHWAVLPGALTRNEERFLLEQNITRIDLSLEEFQARCDPGIAVPEQIAGSLAH